MIKDKFNTILVSIVLGALFIFLFSDFTGSDSKGSRSEIKIDADLSDWDSSPFLGNLTAPWEADLHDQTVFDYTTSDGYFCFYFKIIDCGMRSGRVAFSKDAGLTDYYCLEINPRGDILDYQASYYRKLDDTWDLKTLKSATTITKNGFITEDKIALKELKELGLQAEIHLGIFRADFLDEGKSGGFHGLSPIQKNLIFISLLPSENLA